MFVEPESLQHLRRFNPAFGWPLQAALGSLLDEPPTPTLALSWDEQSRLWRSQMIFVDHLPPEIRRVFEETGYGCLAAETGGGIVHVCHAADADIEQFAGQPISARWELVKMPTAPLVRLELSVFDSPFHPYRFESFLNVGAEDQLAILGTLAGQAELYLAFYGDGLDHKYTVAISHSQQQWQQLDEIVAEALAYWERLPTEVRDFDLAKTDYFNLTD
jgi:hypothetical protein